ncbi:MAG: HAD-IC family P-type ATPase [Phaeodactylibacter sp.]|nr:HAD-IC family P-type ATPase [Phaeodactylibacter sp.]
MLFAMAMVVVVSIYQEVRSANAIRSLKKYTQSTIRLIRDGEEVQLAAEELVPDDIMIVSEGETVPADAEVLRQNDFSVDESIMTGESMPVFRDAGEPVLQGTLVASGLCTARVTQTGARTELARLGKRMESITQEKSLLQKQVSAFVQRMALVGLLAFLLVFGINYLSTFDLVVSLLFGLVMTMSLIPEEIPVAFSSFMAIGAKGAVERILALAPLSNSQIEEVESITRGLAAKGFRVLGVARAASIPETFPERQDDFEWRFLGLVALYDPPKKAIKDVFGQFYGAGIQVKMITGDYAETALTIAGESGMRHNGQYLLSEAVLNMPAEKLREAVRTTDIFARMFPEAKLKVVEALKANGQIVAMTGDGVNDGPALKAAHIGVAMGNRGADIAKKAAALINAEGGTL